MVVRTHSFLERLAQLVSRIAHLRSVGARPTSTVRTVDGPAPDKPAADEWPLDLIEFAPARFKPVDRETRDDAALDPIAAEIFKGVRQILSSTPPSFPWFAARIVDAAESPSTDARKLSGLVASDAFIATQVMRVARSARYAGVGRVQSLQEAIARLGFREVAEIAFVASTQLTLNAAARQAFADFANTWRVLWFRSISSSLNAGWLARKAGGMEESAAFLGGLLHDVGKLVGLQALGSAMHARRVRPVSEAEALVLLELTHVQIGVEVAETCGYPETVVVCCRDHHLRSFAKGPRRRELAAVVTASAIHDLTAGAQLDRDAIEAAASAARTLRLEQEFLRRLASQVRDNQARAQAMMVVS